MKRLNRALCIAALLAGSVALPADEPAGLEVTYVGNEGFLITSGSSKVLIDALYREGVPGYVAIPRDLRRLMNYGSPPFDDIGLVLATHHHADHFDPRAVARHLESNTNALFISTEQTAGRMQSLSGFKSITHRVRGSLPEEGSRERIVRGDMSVDVLNLHHGRGRGVENVGFLVEIGGLKLLHVGDTEATLEEFRVNRLVEEKIDIAFIPYWHLTGADAPRFVEEAIGPRRVVAMHIPPPEDPGGYLESEGGFDGVVKTITTSFPGAVIFREEMETRTIR